MTRNDVQALIRDGALRTADAVHCIDTNSCRFRMSEPMKGGHSALDPSTDEWRAERACFVCSWDSRRTIDGKPMKRTVSFLAVAAMWVIACSTASAHGSRVAFYVGVPGWWGPPYVGYPYPGYYPYPPYYPGYYRYPGYYPYPPYPPPGPPIYVERRPTVVAHTPPSRPAPRLERYTLSAQELFAFDRDDLRMPQPKLDEIARELVANPRIKTVTIKGYTDRLGSDAYNLGLSQRRAEAVKAYLVSKGVAPSRLIAIGKGKADAVVRCEDSDRAALIKCLKPNRRVEVEQITVERRIG